MKETKPFFVIRKYRSILRAAIIVESVSFIVSLTDIIVAGNLIGREALTAIGLVAPFMGVLSFLGSVVNSGTLVNYSYLIGRFDRRRANEFFSQGVYMSLVGGAAYALVLLLLREKFVAFCFETAEARQVAWEYFSFILFYFLLQPFSVVLENIVVADGGEKLSVLANITLIVGNIILSILFAVRWGVRGIAMASVTSLILFILVLLLHLFSGSNTVRLVRHWRKQDFLRIVKTGIVKASNYALDALMQMILDILVLSYYDAKALILVVLVQKYLGLTTFFIGLSMAAQPLIGTLLGENNTKALRILMKTVFFDISAIALLMSLLTLWQAPFIAWAFGIDNTALLLRASTALRIIGASLPFQAILILFFIYYVLIDKQLLAFRICLRKNIICPLLFSVLFTVLLGNENSLWTGLALAPAAALLISAGHILLRYGKEQFPLLLREDPERHIFIYDFEITPENAVGISQIAQNVLERYSVAERTQVLAGVFLEDMLELIMEKNGNPGRIGNPGDTVNTGDTGNGGKTGSEGKPGNTGKHRRPGRRLRAECTLIVDPSGVRVILRDSGVIFDITDDDAIASSFRQYVVANMMAAQENKAYLVTTGYNRTELFFSRS